MTSRKLTYGGLMIAFAILLPQAFHLAGVPQSGQVFLPMHIPVLLGGLALGPAFGFGIGVFSPLISSLLTNMPAPDRLPFMIAELAAYGFMSGLMYNTLNFCRRKAGIYISLVLSMVFGRAVYAAALFAAAELLHIKGIAVVMALNATVTGIYGIIIQLVFIPPIIFALERSGYLDSKFRKSQKNTF